MDSDDELTTARAADLLNVSQNTLRRYRQTKCKSPGPPCYRKLGRIFYSRQALLAWLDGLRAEGIKPAKPAGPETGSTPPNPAAKLRRAPPPE